MRNGKDGLSVKIESVENQFPLYAIMIVALRYSLLGIDHVLLYHKYITMTTIINTIIVV